MNKKQLKQKMQKSGDKKFKAKKVGSEIKSDIQGSYTGVPENIYDKPIQDADDL